MINSVCTQILRCGTEALDLCGVQIVLYISFLDVIMNTGSIVQYKCADIYTMVVY